MMESVFVLILFHVEHTSEFPDLVGLSSNHMNYFFILFVCLDQLMQSNLFTYGQRSDDKQLRCFDD